MMRPPLGPAPEGVALKHMLELGMAPRLPRIAGRGERTCRPACGVAGASATETTAGRPTPATLLEPVGESGPFVAIELEWAEVARRPALFTGDKLRANAGTVEASPCQSLRPTFSIAV